jgi:hypothetical protein
MMSPSAVCTNCGFEFPFEGVSFFNAKNVSFENNTTKCPKCVDVARIGNGTYNYVAGVLTAFQAPGVTRQKVEHFAEVARAAKDGTVSRLQADSQIAEISQALLAIWKATGDNAAGIGILLSIVALYLTITAGWSDDIAADKQLKASYAQTEAIHSSEVIQQKILAELRKTSSGDHARAEPKSIVPSSSRITLRRTAVPSGSLNRHERRKARVISRRRTP